MTSGIQRVRIGLTGLACVFLLVVLATAILGVARDPAPADNAALAAAPADNAAEPPREPLAELGVAPGNLPAESDNAASPR